MEIKVISLFLMSGVFLALFLLVYFKGSRGVSKNGYSLFLFSLSVWTLSAAMYYYCEMSNAVLFWSRALYASGTLIASSFLLFSLSLERTLKRREIIGVFLPGSILAVLFLFTSSIIQDVVLKEGVKCFVYGSWHILFDIHFAIAFGIAFIDLLRIYRLSYGVRKMRLRYILLGTGLGVIFAGIANVFLPWFGIFEYIWMGPILALSLVSCTVYGIIRYQLMDVKIVVARAIVFGAVYVPLLLLPMLITIYKKEFLMHQLGEHFWLFPTLLEGGIAVLGLFAYQNIKQRTEKRILHEEYARSEKIEDISNYLMCIDEMENLAKELIEKTKAVANITQVLLYLEDAPSSSYTLMYQESFENQDFPKRLGEESPLLSMIKQGKDILVVEHVCSDNYEACVQLQSMQGVVVVPAWNNNKLLGFMVLGEKEDRSAYNPIELTAFKMLGNQVAVTIEYTKFVEELKRVESAVNEAKRMKEFEYLTSAIGHEIGNCIQAVGIVMSDFMVDPLFAERFSEDKELESETMTRVTQVLDLVKNIRMIVRTLSQYIKNEQPLEMKEIHMRELLESVIVLLHIRNPEMKQMRIDIEGDAKVWGNSSSLQSVFYNMLNNCYDAILMEEMYLKREAPELLDSYKGFIEITICSKNDVVEIHVKDNGVGMRPDAQEKIFAAPLFTTKGHDVRKNKRLTGGVGIGMYTIRKMLLSHGGNISITFSEQHKGTDFMLQLPMRLFA